MTTTLDTSRDAAADPRRFRALGVIAIAQLMIVLDATVVTIALPSAQRALHISVANRQWVMTAYTLAFGGLLLLGGRVADYLGRRRVFVASLIGFAAASALGGLSANSGMLFGARALQGAMAALMAPAALSLITITFTEPHERARAFGVYGAISGGGAAIGLILGGLLTQYVSWRWTLLINVPIALATAAIAPRLIAESRSSRRTTYDVPGAAAATGGLLALVYGFTHAETGGWGSAVTIGCLAVGVALLAAFVAIERRTGTPLLPLRVVLDRNRGGSFLASLLTGLALFGTFLFLTFFLQSTLHYSAIRSGFAFLPFSVGIAAGAGVSSWLLPRTGPRPLLVTGFAAAAVGLGLFTQLHVTSTYFLDILPAELITSFGMGVAFVPLSSTALIGVDPQDAGVASALVNSTQQVGGAIGTALLNTVAATATSTYLAGHRLIPDANSVAIVHGYTSAFLISGVLLAAAAAVALLLVRSDRSAPSIPIDFAPAPAS